MAIVDVLNALRGWNRYSVSVKRREAEILVVVCKGRIVSVNGSVGGNVGSDLTIKLLSSNRLLRRFDQLRNLLASQ
jgi:hypothetical protein